MYKIILTFVAGGHAVHAVLAILVFVPSLTALSLRFSYVTRAASMSVRHFCSLLAFAIKACCNCVFCITE